MLKPFLQATFIILVFLATLAACSDPTPNPETLDPTYTPAPTAAPTATATATPVPTESQAERPTAAPKATPSSPPTPEPTANPVSLGVPAPLQALDISALLSELSANELACIGDDAGKLVRSLTGPSSAPREEQTRFFGCLEDETVARIFLAGFVPGPEPLSQETSDCVRAAFEVIDPRAVMTAGIEGDPGRAMAGSMAALSVLDFTQNPGKVMDDITFVRSHWWLVSEGFSLSTANSDVQKLPATLYHRIADSLAYAA